MKKTIKIDEKKLKVNPYLNKLTIRVTKVINAGEHKFDNSGKLHPVSYFVERQQSCRLFYDLDSKKKVFDLSSCAKEMYLYILYNLESGQDWIFINRDRYMEMNNVGSVNTVKKALSELWECEFIAPVPAYPNQVYWINPAIFFSGSRIAKYPDHLIVKSTVTR